jgi:hypothetical protein
MTQPDDPGPCGEASERLATQAEVLASRASIMRAVRLGAMPQPVPVPGILATTPDPCEIARQDGDTLQADVFPISVRVGPYSPAELELLPAEEQKRTEVDVSRPLSSSVPFCSPLCLPGCPPLPNLSTTPSTRPCST